MNHNSLIRSLINKYSHLPQVQMDMRKVLKYASSQNRMFLDPIINNEPPKSANSKLAALQASTDDFEASEAFTAEVKADALKVMKAITAQIILARPGAYAAAWEELAVKYSDQSTITEYLKQVAQIVLTEIEEIAPADLIQMRGAA
ncbi:hypothetical protein Gbem_3684 [Citrifermentans bemidjiense Bem]|uniref:Uncharacterized protein n=1 Tax=Citrifermentans bemidjiense (strain ATCC BAA-1014 / DSM 16622 / JCM 12645 / Bem) TaxID=404380 RepID=B5EDP8_CITBB|nr:hypothetical protein [Citrifermentans bemidjiense]ACH40676.1 hypothetical protein Gbem_3684 [Citrifermentans bemidjiense Bem]